MIKINNLLLVIKDRFIEDKFNFISNTLSLFNRNSHISSVSNDRKVEYKTKEVAKEASKYMEKKYKVCFSSYKCLYCDSYHIGKSKG